MPHDIQDYFQVIKETSEGWRTNCPRCQDTEMKLYWNTEKRVGCCFHNTCPWFKDSGGVTEFRLRAFLGKEGVEIVIPEVVKAAPEAAIELPEGFETLREMSKYHSGPIYDYLESRGLRRKIVDRAKVGYVRKGKMWGYIIFPVLNLDGELIYWQGRRFKDRKPKFFNPPSSLRSEITYQIRSSRKPETVILVESIINALTLESAWEGNDVVILATMGKGWSKLQMDRVLAYERFLKELWIAYDPDALRDALDVADYFGTRIEKIRIPIFPEEEDINSLGFSKSYKIMKNAEVYTGKNRMKFLTAGV